MKVGIVSALLQTRRGGAEAWTFGFARWLVERGHDVHALVRKSDPAVEQAGIHVHTLPIRSRLAFGRAVQEKLAELQVDVSHDMGCVWGCDVFQPHLGSPDAVRERTKHLLSAPSRLLRPYIERLLPRYRETAELTRRQFDCSGPTHFLALSNMVAADMRSFHGVPSERISVIYNGVDAARFDPARRTEQGAGVRRALGVGEDEMLLLLVAHNHDLKGAPALLQAAGKLNADGGKVHAAVVGGKPSPRHLRLAERCGLSGRAHFVGPKDDTAPYYMAADVYVHPTFYDACSLVVLEALASGLPVITSRFNGAGELIIDDVHGCLLQDPADAGELAELLRRFNSNDRRRRMGLAARAFAEQQTFEKNYEQIFALYERLTWNRKAA